MPRTKTKRGQSKAAVEARQQRFCEVYLANGENGTRAFMEVFECDNENVAGVSAHQLLKNPKVSQYLDRRRNEMLARYKLTTENWMREAAAVAFFNPKRLVTADGKPIPLHQLPDDVAAGLSIMELDQGPNGAVISRYRPHSKTTALDITGKALRVYDAPPPPPPDADQPVDTKQSIMRIAYLLRVNQKRLEKKA